MTQALETVLRQIALHPAAEWVGVFTGLLCVWLAARNIIWNWPFAIINVLIYLFLFCEKKLYADAGLQVYFLATNIYGWYYWSRKSTQKERPITQLKHRHWIWCAGTIILFTFLVGFLLQKNTDATFPFLDSFCTACSLLAQYLLARRVLQNWIIWLFVDLLYIGIYVAKDLSPTAWMYAIYATIALKGFYDWRKIYREQAD